MLHKRHRKNTCHHFILELLPGLVVHDAVHDPAARVLGNHLLLLSQQRSVTFEIKEFKEVYAGEKI